MTSGADQVNADEKLLKDLRECEAKLEAMQDAGSGPATTTVK